MLDAMPKRLKEEREKKNLKQTDVAKILKITQSTYAGYEIGRRQPDVETLKKIADIYQTSMDYLAGRYN